MVFFDLKESLKCSLKLGWTSDASFPGLAWEKGLKSVKCRLLLHVWGFDFRTLECGAVKDPRFWV